MRTRSTAICWFWLALVAAPAASADVEHDRIRRERDEAAQRYASRQRECLARFVSASCLDAARAEQRDTLQRLRREQLEIDEKARRDTVADRQRSVDAARARGAARRSSQDAASAVPQPTAASTPRRPTEAPGRLFPDRSAMPRLERARSAEVAASRTARLEARHREADAHREKVLERNAERAARGKLAAPLPVPDAASTPVRR